MTSRAARTALVAPGRKRPTFRSQKSDRCRSNCRLRG
nr:MAG TPA: hypothetical protein [Caudoviricetes sp.]